MATFLLLARSCTPRGAAREPGRSAAASVVLMMMAASLACSRRGGGPAPVVVAWLEVLRWGRLGSTARRAARVSWIALSLLVAS